ncbi:MAG: hypothetical protein ACK559_37065, partial [bacterium]
MKQRHSAKRCAKSASTATVESGQCKQCHSTWRWHAFETIDANGVTPALRLARSRPASEFSILSEGNLAGSKRTPNRIAARSERIGTEGS